MFENHRNSIFAMNVSASLSRNPTALYRIYILLMVTAAVASTSLRLSMEPGTNRDLDHGHDVTGPTAAGAPDNLTNSAAASGRFGDRRRHVIRGEREAAVITRLPQMKTEVCRAERLEQTVKERGCLPRTVVNRYCYGQCNSFFIPRAATQPTATGRHAKQPQQQQQQKQLPQQSETSSFETNLAADLEPAQTGYNRRRPNRAGSMSAGSELPSSASSSSSSMNDAIELQWQAFKSCSFCRPKRVAWITVGLNCPRRRPAYRRRKVQIIKECACTALTFD